MVNEWLNGARASPSAAWWHATNRAPGGALEFPDGRTVLLTLLCEGSSSSFSAREPLAAVQQLPPGHPASIRSHVPCATNACDDLELRRRAVHVERDRV